MRAISINSTAARFDIVDDFNRIFWRDMDADTALAGVQKLGTMYRVIPATGLDYGQKVSA